MSVTDPLRVEHRELLAAIDDLKAVADAIGYSDATDVHDLVEHAHQFLVHHLLPHAHAEEVALYPMVGRVLGAARATATMSRDHVEILKLTARLGALLQGPLELDDVAAREMRALLYGLHAIVRLHVTKEDEVYLPLLDERLTQPEANRMFDAMARAAKGDPG